jgi:hypothetical protein
MSQAKKTPSAAPKPPKKLIPRTAPKVEVALAAEEVVVPDLASAEVVIPVAKLAPAAKTKAPAKSAVTAAEKAAAAPIKNPLGKATKPAKTEKPPKAKKVKLVRDSYAMPESEYAQIAQLKKTLAAQGVDVKKSELLRAGLAVLVALDAAELQTVMSHIVRIKTGRPAK